MLEAETAHLLDRARTLARSGDRAGSAAAYVLLATQSPQALDAILEGAHFALAQDARSAVAELLERGLRAHPAAAGLYALRAVLCHLEGDLQAAIESAQSALRIEPSGLIANGVVASIALTRGEPSRALVAADAALARQPRAAPLWRDRGRAQLDRGDPTAAVASLRQAHALDPRDAATRANLLLASLYDSKLDATAVRELHLEVNPPGAFGSARAASHDALPSAAGAARPLRVGVLSADLRTHPVGIFSGAWLALADPARVAWVVYDNASGKLEADAVAALLRARVPEWRHIAQWTDAACLSAMRADSLDVLLDLSGHTAGARPALIAARAAPLQLAYLGYPAPTAAAGIDAMIADAVTMPEGSEVGWPETVLRLPHAFLCYEPYPGTPEVSARAEDATPTFGSFNNLAKLDAATVALWSRVLQAVPAARMLLCAAQLGEGATVAYTQRRFAAHGIAPERVVCAPPVSHPAQLLARYAEVDVALDPLRFNGGTTTMDALWQGVPVVTLPGDIMPSRMGASLLKTAGLQDWIAGDADDYIRIATRAVGDRDALARLRTGMREQLSGTMLLDGQRFAAALLDLIEIACAQARDSR